MKCFYLPKTKGCGSRGQAALPFLKIPFVNCGIGESPLSIVLVAHLGSTSTCSASHVLRALVVESMLHPHEKVVFAFSAQDAFP